MPLILASNSASGGYEVDNSLRFDVASTDFLIKTIASTGSSQIWTASGWIKRQQLGASSSLYCSSDSSAGNNFRSLFINASDQVQCAFINVSYTFQVETNALLRDVSAWYHIVAAVDTTQATASDRVKIWINGVLQTSFATASYPTQNATINFSTSGYKQLIASLRDSSTILNGCYLAEMHILDGVAKQASDFGQTDPSVPSSGIWIPKAYSGSYGTNGFYLKFANSASLGTDSSGNGNTFTVNNLTSVDQSTDTPTNNFCTLNALSKGSALSLTNGNLTCTNDSTWRSVMSTIAVSTGKWYWEAKVVSLGTINFGVTKTTQDGTTHASVDAGRLMYSSNGNIYDEGFANSPIATGTTFTTNDIIGLALDLINGTLAFYKNGTLVYTYSNAGLTTNEMTPANGVNSATGDMNFGSPPYSANSYTDGAGYGNFSYAVPAGYYSLNTKNLATYG